MTQAQTNPFPNSDTNKRYYTYDYYLRKTFGGKCAKLPLDVGFTCPNIDGRCGRGGCIYCSDRGSGDFAPEAKLSVAEQIRVQRELFARKWDVSRCIAYFQAHTNTYAPLPVLRTYYEEALAQEGVVGLNIATRADCLPPDVVDYLAALSERTVWAISWGLPSANSTWLGSSEPDVQALPDEAAIPSASSNSNRDSPSMPSKHICTLPGRRFSASPFKTV